MSLAYKESTYSWDHLVDDISHEVSKLTGNVMSEKQRPMVESRMRRRCLDLKFNTPVEYRTYWRAHTEAENKVLIGLLTTHFTSFFREFLHFEWIAEELPTLVASARKEGRSTLKFWSAASSKGQEVWSLCMWLNHHMPKIDASMKWEVHGSDIDQVSVKEGENGVYHRRELETAPRHLWEGQWVRGKGDIEDWYKIKAELKSHAHFQTQNLLSLTVPVTEKFDVIMCRNVLIYFDRTNQENIVKSLLKYLTPQGALITGMSESLSGYGLPIKGMAPSVYKSQTALTLEPAAKKVTTPSSVTLPVPLRVLCVDDSPTVITILKKILKAPDFEIVGTANNGEEAMEKMKTLKPDVITLDLHMPVMDGPTFLKTSGAASTIPVVVVSSVDRDHAPLISPLKDLGVCDFVEKPTLGNINDIADELAQKLKMGWIAKKKNPGLKSESFSTTTYKQRPAGHIVFNFSPSDEGDVLRVLSEQKWSQDELTFFVNGAVTPALRDKIQLKLPAGTRTNYVTVGDKISSTKKTVWLMFKGANTYALRINRRPEDFMVMEEQFPDQSLKSSADDILPSTSFSYLVDKLLGGK